MKAIPHTNFFCVRPQARNHSGVDAETHAWLVVDTEGVLQCHSIWTKVLGKTEQWGLLQMFTL